MNIILGFILGSIVSSFSILLMVGASKSKKECEIYMEGFAAGQKNPDRHFTGDMSDATMKQWQDSIQYRIDTASHLIGAGADGHAFADLEFAIQAIEQYRQYKQIGTIEELQQLKDNSRPKPVLDLDEDRDYGICSVCGRMVVDCVGNRMKYCTHCGSLLNWEQADADVQQRRKERIAIEQNKM